MGLDYRPYQLAAIEGIRQQLRHGRKRVGLYLPTGAGKTVCAIAIIEGALRKGKRVAFLANRIHLVSQASDRFDRQGIDHGIIQGDNTRDTDKPVVIASIQTAARRGLPSADVIIIDEFHGVAGSKDYRELIFLNSNRTIIGLSATPFSRGLGKRYPDLQGPLFEHLVVGASISELIEQGHLVDAEFYAPETPDLSGVRTQRNSFGEVDYAERDLAEAMDKPKLVGDIVDHWLRLARGTPTVCFAVNIAHSKSIVAQFRSAGIAAEHIDCYTGDAERHAVLARVDRGETQVISNVGILAEGWDFPACQTMILARPTKSLIRHIQMIGRVLRPHPGKTHALVLDHSGTVKELGFHTDPFPLVLDDGKPRKAAERKGREKLPRLCPSCKYLKPAGVHACPKCSFKPERQSDIEPEHGELVKLSKGMKSSYATKQQIYSELLCVAQRKHYSPGWVAHKYRELFGVWPKGMTDSPAEPSQATKNWLLAGMIRYAKGKEKQRAAA